MRNLSSAAILLTLAALGARAGAAAPPISFGAQVQPFLQQNCAGCHGGPTPASGLSMENAQGLLKGGEKSGPAIIPGHSKDSPIIQYLRGQKSPQMPLGGKASPDQIALIARWIDEGARVVGSGVIAAPPPPRWPFTRPVLNTPPAVKDRAWVRNPIDAFVLAKLEAHGLKPAPEASKRELIRRAVFDLTGLPPTPAQILYFLNDTRPDAYERLVDRLLASPQYGERWARHWLDLARYADTNGFEADQERPNAWRYRDYVIKAFNTDKPYNRFIEEQIAGDEMWPKDPDALVATGFLRNGPWDSLAFDKKAQRNDFLTDVTDTTGSVFLGLTVGCARCHDHKYDPIPQKDYYSLQAFFSPIRLEDNMALPGMMENGQPAHAMVAVDSGKTVGPDYLLRRGDVYNPGEEVQPRFLSALAGLNSTPTVVPPAGENSTGRRTALAEWLASPDNPQTARVMVNRIWQYHFGQGIVGTPSDFGKNGEPPSHKELLDWLAVTFVAKPSATGDDGCDWSIKKMQRLIMTSSTYRQSTRLNQVAVRIDPENKLLWRMNRQRLEGEEIRDAILQDSGRLNLKMGGPGVYPVVDQGVLQTGSTIKWGSSPLEEQLRRTIYVFQRRSIVLPIVDVFDGADMANTCPRRAVTTIAPQALALLNGSFAYEQAGYFAKRVVAEMGSDPGRDVNQAFLIAFGRYATPTEMAACRDYLAKQAALHRQDAGVGSAPVAAGSADPYDLAALTDLCHVLYNANEFVYLE